MAEEGGRTFFHSCEVDADLQRLPRQRSDRSHGQARHRRLSHARGSLYRYLAGRPDAQIDGKVLVELEGPISEERDLDADDGALLVCPERIVSVTPLDPSVVETIRARDADRSAECSLKAFPATPRSK